MDEIILVESDEVASSESRYIDPFDTHQLLDAGVAIDNPRKSSAIENQAAVF
jgi:hypothetical protein